MALGRKTGGRKKGSQNKRTQASVIAAEAGGIMPLPALLKIMRYWLARADQQLKLDEPDRAVLHQALTEARTAAKDAAPYLHASIKAQIQVPLGDAGKLAEFREAKNALIALVDRVAASREAGGSPPTTH
jgi:hypothetical protein